MNKCFILLGFIPLLTGCFDSDIVFEDQYEPVVEAYLYVDKEVGNIQLSSMISFGSDSSGGEKITDALIVLEGEADSWVLSHDDSTPGRYYMEERPEMVPGDIFRLRVELEEESLIAITVIPDNPPAVSMSSRSISIPKVDNMMDFRNVVMPDPVELTWNNPGVRYYFLNIQNIESYPIPIMPDPPENSRFATGGFAFQMITQPTNNSYYSIDIRQLEYFGTHRIVFTSVNDEYVYLYNSLNQDTRELNEPYTNVENGLGIFTAFNSDTLYLEVLPDYQ
ncbi:MAG: DUF4249 domain-containing protein [Bacteroidales bacterium]|nr:DUF4249 domain-containing protein [Bacteroidales bacterium]